jgi:serralysin
MLIAGTSQHQFVFNTALGASNIDKIQGYRIADDTILLNDAVFTVLGAPGTLASSRLLKFVA